MPSPDRVALAQEKLAARARRIRLIRQRVVASALAAFVLAWGIIAFDGSKGATTTVASTSTSTAAATTSASSGDTTSSDDAPATMTTGQS